MAATLGGCVEYAQLVEHPRYYGKVLGSNPGVVIFLVQQPPYARDQYITLFNQFYMLITRIPIARQDTSHDMNFFAILVHREGLLEETVMIPVPASFFEDRFLPDDPSSPSPSSPPSSSSTVIPNSSLPPPTLVTIAEPPFTHDWIILPPLATLLNSLEKLIKTGQGSGSNLWKRICCIFL
ncbi:hypothetical protein M422DRAFT_250762 [Sphaerobolus stellatus SS14]|uniref:Uncharacterized protein n=1 Tax=Sphaerobolus stellatus (strain SS14) TaxID=990650 RepID=A0A0C9W328_SPHS4|nr:hypothetical protein M422DRAFT_250762 [Sphaerobolus stellatus SS14]